MVMDLKLLMNAEVNQALDSEIRRGLCESFPPDVEFFSKTRSWHGSYPAWIVFIDDNGKIAAHVGVVDRTVEISGRKLRVAGIQNVYVLGEYRGQHLCDKIMNRAMEEAAKQEFDCGLLFCVPGLTKVYARCGWTEFSPDRVIRTDEKGEKIPLPSKNTAMYYPLKIKSFPQGTIDLCGNDW